ncbi:hypothetical protein WA026_003128, partial [Henosepilachna vigintioctopunctata]
VSLTDLLEKILSEMLVPVQRPFYKKMSGSFIAAISFRQSLRSYKKRNVQRIHRWPSLFLNNRTRPPSCIRCVLFQTLPLTVFLSADASTSKLHFLSGVQMKTAGQQLRSCRRYISKFDGSIIRFRGSQFFASRPSKHPSQTS